jgi:UTP--glucose-1-phosphate uridylyltransferase
MPSVIRKAVVPIAGLGTRHFPASHAVKKELFPIVGPDGIARALFHYHLRELVAADFEEICFVVQPGEQAMVRAYLDGPGDTYLKRLAKYPALVEEARQMRDFSTRIRFAVQETQEGYGHAIFQTREFAAGETIFLCLGDHLFRGRTQSPYRELADLARASGGLSVSGVTRIGPAELKSYGTVAGRRRQGDPRLIDLAAIIEKPDVKTARERLHVDGLPPDTWLAWLGMHVLTPSIYDVLDEMIRDNVRDNGEFQLTRAQEIQRERHGHLALEMNEATRFDFGIPDDFVKSVGAFSMQSL